MLPAGSFSFPDAPTPPDARTLVVTVLDTEGYADGTLIMQAAWTLMAGHSARVVLTRQVKLDSKVEGRRRRCRSASRCAERHSRKAGRPDRNVGQRALTSKTC